MLRLTCHLTFFVCREQPLSDTAKDTARACLRSTLVIGFTPID